MTKNRPYFNKSIADLEKLHTDDGSDDTVLQQIRQELEFRTTARAAKLKNKIAKPTKVIASKKVPKSPRVTSQKKAPSLKAPSLNVPIEKPAAPAPQQTSTLPQEKIVLGPKPPITNETQNILRAWTALEVLSPQGYRRETDLTGGDRSRIASLDNSALPWEAGEKSRPKKRLYYELILGTINLGPAVEALLKLYSDNRPDAPRISRRSPIASILLDKEGRPLEEDTSFAISSFAWGVPIALKGDLKLLAQWPTEERRIVRAFRGKLIQRDNDGEVYPLTKSSIDNLYTLLVDALHLTGHDISPPHFAIRRFEFFASKVPPEPSLLNSFFLEDLAKARLLAEQSKLPHALQFYLSEASPTNRIDLLEDHGGLSDLLQPSLTPLGRWPGPGRFPLALLQQAAVNGTSDGLVKTGVLSVNGPPGTGKTTLLRDIVAARIVERASVMVGFKNPENAFTPTGQTLQQNGAKITLHRLDDRLKGFEMVVASSNNKAVENVSAELPALDAIASDATELRYFSSISDKLLERESWGAVAAVLGNSSNRYQFSQTFWRDDENGLSTYLNHAAGTPQYVTEQHEDGPPIKRLREVVRIEQPPNNKREAQSRWEKARAVFVKELGIARKTQTQLQKLYESIKRLVGLANEYRETASLMLDNKKLIVELTALQNQADGELVAANGKLQSFKKIQSFHAQTKPGLFARFFRTKSARDWKSKNDEFSTEHQIILRDVQNHRLRSDQVKQDLAKKQTDLVSAQEKLEQIKFEYQDLNEQVTNECSKKNVPVPNVAFFEGEHDQIQIANLWFEKADHIQRDRVFEVAMAVHRAFIDCAADPLRQNLAIFTETFGTRSFGTPQKDQLIPDLWSTFFLVVPVVSTTFASVHRMFSRLEPETLGWLLVDEAGQALPQAAVGAIMRSKRVVAVGDPLQIEPVVTLPNTLTEEICAFFGIEALKYNAPEASVQTMADAASEYCARFPIGSGHRNVGSPLLVHRRCDSPMFDISNEIAYANLMVQAKKPTDQHQPIGPSCWFNVVGKAGPDKWCADEVVKIIELLGKLREENVDPDIYVITPFVIVQDNLRRQLIDSGVLDGWVDGTPRQWVSEHVGTVHTVQGREAETVFFVLGAQAPSQNGARNWAGYKPNLVNVAVTRAKSSLYVIGNRDLWKSAGVFAVLDRLLPHDRIE